MCIQFLLIGMIVAMFWGVSTIFSGFKIDRRPVSSSGYELMHMWMTKPIAYGRDYTSLIPMIKKAMEDDHVYLSEWQDIRDAQEVIDRETARALLKSLQ